MAGLVIGMITLGRPLLHSGFAQGHDLSAHATYVHLFDLALGQGQVPVRWTESIRQGHSQPLFSFYQPGFYYLVELVHVVVPRLSTSLKLTVVALWCLGAAFMYLLCLPRGRLPAALAAVVFAFSPYLLLDVYVRAAYPEFAALALVPGLLWAIDRVNRAPSGGAVALVAAITGLMLVCHLPTVLIVAPLCAVHASRMALRAGAPRRTMLSLAGAAALAVGLAAFYLLPALGELDLIQIRALTRDYFDYRRHFVEPVQWMRYSWGYGGSVEGATDAMSFQIGVVQWAVLLVAAAFTVRAALRRRFDLRDRDLVEWLGGAAFGMFMMTAASAPIWGTVTALSFLQFPWRYLMVVAIACGPLAAGLLARVPGERRRAAIFAAALGLLIVLSHDQRRPSAYLPTAAMHIDDPKWRFTPEAQAGAFIEAGYYPTTAPAAPRGADDGRRWRIEGGHAIVAERTVKDHAVDLRIHSDSAVDLVITSHAFPHWIATIDGERVEIGADRDTGYLRVRVPPGRHRVEVRLEDTPLRRVANATTLGSMLVLLGLVAVPGRRWRDRTAPPIRQQSAECGRGAERAS
jgi:hypothetical protein